MASVPRRTPPVASTSGFIGNATSKAKYGRIVSAYLGGKESSDSANGATGLSGDLLAEYSNRQALRNGVSSGAMAVKFHMDYARVLEDALYSEVTRVATQAIYYAGVINAVSGAASATNVKAGAMFKVAGAASDGTKVNIAFTFTDRDGGVHTASARVGNDDYVLVDSTWGVSVVESRDSAVAIAAGHTGYLTVSVEANAEGRDKYSIGLAPELVGRIAAEESKSLDLQSQINAEVTNRTNAVSAAQTAAEAYADSLAGNYDQAGAAATAEGNAKGYADSLAGNYDQAGAAATAEGNAKGYADSLAGNYDQAGAAATAEGNAKGYADSLAGNYDQAGAASAAQTAAQSYADGLAVNYDAAGAASAAQTAAQSYADRGIAAEASSRMAGVGLLTTNLAAEASYRIAADAGLTTSIAVEASSRAAADAGLTTSIAAEASSRAAADAGLTTSIAAEASSRAAADAGLTTGIAAEASSRAAADAGLASNIAAEASVRTVADANLKMRLDYLVGSLNKTMKTAVDRFRLLESFMSTAEQFIQMSSDGSNVLDFTSSLGAYSAAAYAPEFGLGLDAALPAALPSGYGLDFLSMANTLSLSISSASAAAATTSGIAPDETVPTYDAPRAGWYFAKTATSGQGNKINWYFYRNANVSTTLPYASTVINAADTYGSFKSGGGAWALVTIDKISSKADIFFTLYTAPSDGNLALLGPNDQSTFYQSVRNFVAETDFPIGTKVLVTVGSVPLDIFPLVPRMALTKEIVPPGVIPRVGTRTDGKVGYNLADATEPLASIALNTNSVAAVNGLAFVVHNAGAIAGTAASNTKIQLNLAA